ncbi:MAG: carbohydrate kinase [Bacteroidetes bacterium]|nr:MAG: carbohydrate kinase [Bacteroidota bacterium]
MQATEIFERFGELNIVVIGDVMIDRYLSGTVERISPEAPVPVIQLQEEDNRLGGAGNVALNLQALGCTPHLLSVVGQDANGELLRQLLPREGISDRYLWSSPTRQTTVKTRVLAQHQQLLRADREDQHPLDPAEQQGLLTKLRELLDSKDIDLILFQDYNKGVLSKVIIREVILEALRRDIPTVVDPKYDNFWAYKHVTLFKPNLREIQQQLGTKLKPELGPLLQASREINRKLGNEMTIITLSDKGLFLQYQDQAEIIPTQTRTIADVCGAGDTVISVAAAALALGASPREIAQLANLAGGQVCEKVGVVPVNRNQLLQEYERLLAVS